MKDGSKTVQGFPWVLGEARANRQGSQAKGRGRMYPAVMAYAPLLGAGGNDKTADRQWKMFKDDVI